MKWQKKAQFAISIAQRVRQSFVCSKYALGLDVQLKGNLQTTTFLALKCSFLEQHV